MSMFLYSVLFDSFFRSSIDASSEFCNATNIRCIIFAFSHSTRKCLILLIICFVCVFTLFTKIKYVLIIFAFMSKRSCLCVQQMKSQYLHQTLMHWKIPTYDMILDINESYKSYNI
eukprot:107552_1